MFDVFGDLNWLGLVIGFVVLTVLGGVWFGAIFPKAYNRSLGRPDHAKPDASVLFYAGPAVMSLVITFTSAVLIAALGITAVADGLLFGLIVGVGYLAANTVTIAINPNFPRPLSYAAISGAYNLLGSLLVSTILVAV